jgi:hypothetical protein
MELPGVRDRFGKPTHWSISSSSVACVLKFFADPSAFASAEESASCALFHPFIHNVHAALKPA